MHEIAGISETELARFARLAAPLVGGLAAQGFGSVVSRSRPGPGLEFLDTRPYEPGDELRHVDWRQSARQSHVVLRRFRNEASADWTLCIDASPSVAAVEGKWPVVVQLSAALSYLFLHAGHRVSLLMFADTILGYCQMGRGARHFSAVADTLLRNAAVRPGQVPEGRINASNLGLCAERIAAGANVFVISDFLRADGMRTDLRAVRAVAGSTCAMQVCSAADAQVAGKGRVTLQDAETAHDLRTVATADNAATARRRLEELRSGLRKDCGRMRIRYARCDTSEGWERALLRFFSGGS